ncbi:MAG: COX15/CtaA family protein [Gemmatimonadales bacterium]|nr:COX15/CtaA family protein [Gemmatimonadales bacterium]
MTRDLLRSIDRGDARALGRWLAAWAFLVFLTVVVGGATRLTESGLSITEWKPVTGVVPPLSEAQWEEEFAKYRRIPQYAQMNPDMDLAGFKRIYLWEFVHRIIARLVGAAFLLPLIWFALRRRIPRALAPTLATLLALLAAQGAMGWWMVASGLSVRTEVSQYRLAAHLSMALILFALTVWTAADLLRAADLPAGEAPPERGRGRTFGALTGLVLLTAFSGALVAGLRAGKVYNSFPFMGDGLVPPGYASMDPWWRNLFENHGAVQFDHRLLATATLLAVLATWWRHRATTDARFRVRVHAMLGVVLLQFALGVTTLLLAVPISLGVAHQGGAVLLLTVVLLAWHSLPPASIPPRSSPSGTGHPRPGAPSP